MKLPVHMKLLAKEFQIEKTATQLSRGQRSQKQKIAAVICIELGLLGANAFAARRVVTIHKAWRKAKIGEVITKTKATINIVTNPPPFMAPIIAPFQLFFRAMKPFTVIGLAMKDEIQKRGALAAMKWDRRKIYFTNVLLEEIG